MSFFSEWLITRLRESGWPKSEGVFRKRHYYTDESVNRATQDVVRIGLALGSNDPNAAKGIAIAYSVVTPSTTRQEIDEWVSEASAKGSKKWEDLSDTRPQWLRFCSLTYTNDCGKEMVGVWTGNSDKYYLGSTETSDLFRIALALPLIAMSWAIVHPKQALIALDDYPDRDEELEQFGEVTGPSSGWIEMARNSIAIFSNKFGLPVYDDKETWNLGSNSNNGQPPKFG